MNEISLFPVKSSLCQLTIAKRGGLMKAALSASPLPLLPVWAHPAHGWWYPLVLELGSNVGC